MDNRQVHFCRKEKRTDPLSFAMQLGFFAGLIWGGVRWVAYTFHFTSVIPSFIIQPFFKHGNLATVSGQFIGWGAFILFSIAASILYMFLLRKIPGPYAGLLYGFIWWILLFVVLGPQLGLMVPVWKTTWNTIGTELCILLIWGLFIGYTVAIEFNDEREREPRHIEFNNEEGRKLNDVELSNMKEGVE